MNPSAHRLLLLAALLPALGVLLPGCVKKSEYDALQVENQTLQARVDEASRQVELSQAELAAIQARSRELLETQAQLQKARQELQDTQKELQTLKETFEKFRTQRRQAMIGKKIPKLALDDGKVLHEAEIIAVTPDEVSIRHDGGLVKVAMAFTNDDLRWEACYDPQEAAQAARLRMLAEARALDARLARERAAPQEPPIAQKMAISPLAVLTSRLAAQRQQLNAEYQALAARNPGALNGVPWDSARPEASPLLNSVSGSRAVLGLSRLQSLRDAINQTLQQMRSLEPSRP